MSIESTNIDGRDELSAPILNLLNEIIFFSEAVAKPKQIYLYGVDTTDENIIRQAIKIVNMRVHILNIVEPSRDLTYLLIKMHFTPYIEDGKIVWSFW